MADLLRLCAFLAPDDIPEELIINGASKLGSPLQALAHDETLLDEMIGTLRRFSLLQRHRETQSLSLHRLVQTIIRANMSEKQQRQWAKRAIQAIEVAFPNVTDVPSWPECERYLPHALVGFELVKRYHFTFKETTFLLNQVVFYLQDHALYQQAELLLQQELVIEQKTLGPDHPDTARSLNNLAELYRMQGDYEQAEPLYQQALAIWQKSLGSDHPNINIVRNNYTALLQQKKQKEK